MMVKLSYPQPAQKTSHRLLGATSWKQGFSREMKVVQHMGVGGDGAEDVEGVLLGSGGMLAVLEYTVSTQYVGMSLEGLKEMDE